MQRETEVPHAAQVPVPTTASDLLVDPGLPVRVHGFATPR